MGIGDWGLGIGDWGLGIGPNPQTPIPNPPTPIPLDIFYKYFKYDYLYNKLKIFKFNLIINGKKLRKMF